LAKLWKKAAILGETIVEEIDETGGVAINDFDEVAFHGRVVFNQTLI
jgi:hypothetical protein